MKDKIAGKVGRLPVTMDVLTKLKSPKEARLSDGVMVDLFATSSFFCPVEAFRKYVAALPFTLEDSSPLFRSSSGVGYTGAGFNSDLSYVKCPRVKRMKIAKQLATGLLAQRT